MTERCAICDCRLHRGRDLYAKDTPSGRSHASRHHHVAERFFGRSANRRGTLKRAIFSACPWEFEGKAAAFCYECHELLLHNPVLLPAEIDGFAQLVKTRGLAEDDKPEGLELVAGRIRLLQEVVAAGIAALTPPNESLERSRDR